MIMTIILLADCMQRIETVRIEAIFDLLDFNKTGKISLDGLTILFICLATGIAGILGKDEVPSEEIITTLTLNFFDRLKRASNGTVTKAEFHKWCMETLGTMDVTDFVTMFEIFCSGGPIVKEEEPDDGIPKLITTTEISTPGKHINKRPAKRDIFVSHTPTHGDSVNDNDSSIYSADRLQFQAQSEQPEEPSSS